MFWNLRLIQNSELVVVRRRSLSCFLFMGDAVCVETFNICGRIQSNTAGELSLKPLLWLKRLDNMTLPGNMTLNGHSYHHKRPYFLGGDNYVE